MTAPARRADHTARRLANAAPPLWTGDRDSRQQRQRQQKKKGKTMKVEITTNPDGSQTMVITLPCEKQLQPTKSGKALMVAATHGWQQSDPPLLINGKPLSVNVNACIKA